MLEVVLVGLVLGFIFGGVFLINKGLKRYTARNRQKESESKQKRD
ncbi:hypothetical protein ES708_08956 [subsurface metagenome]